MGSSVLEGWSETAHDMKTGAMTVPFAGAPDAGSEEKAVDRPHDAPADPKVLDKAELKALCRRSDAKGLAQLAIHLGVLAATGWLVSRAWGSYWLPLAWIPHGVALIFLFAPLHECIHRTAFRSRWVNDAVARFCAMPLLLPPRYFRAFHLAHHRWTQDPEMDPELAGGKPGTFGAYLWHLTGLPYWRAQITLVMKHALGRVDAPFIPSRDRPAMVREARVLLGLLAVIAAGSLILQSWAVVVYVVAPALLGQPFLRAYLLAEHTGCPFVPDMLGNTRTTWSNALVRRLAWNMPYHSEHHAYPAVPFHALTRAHRRLSPHIAVQSPGYVAAHKEIVAGMPHRIPPTSGDYKNKKGQVS